MRRSHFIGRRVFAREQGPEDMIGTLLYLVGPGSDFVTGQDVWVNGGRLFHYVGKLDGRQERLAATVVRLPFYDADKVRVRA